MDVREVRRQFDRGADFEQEYEKNLQWGGLVAFVEDAPGLLDPVRVGLGVAGCVEIAELDGIVVCREHPDPSGPCRIAIQLDGTLAAVRDRVASLLDYAAIHDECFEEEPDALELDDADGYTLTPEEPPCGDEPDVATFAGEIDSLGLSDVLKTVASRWQAGTLVARRNGQEVQIGFDGSLLHGVELDSASGEKALVRVLGWESGAFEFRAALDPALRLDHPTRLASALLDAEAKARDWRKMRKSSLMERRLVAHADEETAELTDMERTVLALVRAGLSGARIVDVVPEPDPDVFAALDALRRSRAIEALPDRRRRRPGPPGTQRSRD